MPQYLCLIPSSQSQINGLYYRLHCFMKIGNDADKPESVNLTTRDYIYVFFFFSFPFRSKLLCLICTEKYSDISTVRCCNFLFLIGLFSKQLSLIKALHLQQET